MTSLSGARVATCLAAVAVVGGSGAIFASPAHADDGTLATTPSAEFATVAPDAGAVLGALAESEDTADAAPAAPSEPTGGADTNAAEPSADAAAAAAPTVVDTPEGGFFTPPPPPAEPTPAGTPEGGFFTSPAPRRATPTVVATPEGTPQATTDPPQRRIDTAMRPHIGVDTTPPQRIPGRSRPTVATGAEGGAAPASASGTTDTAAQGSDTSADTGPSGGGDQTQPGQLPAATQSSPSNVNVSVRIGSPGDAGPVTQVNLAAVVTGGATAASPLTGAAAALGDAVGSASATSSPGAGPETTPSSTAEGSGTWSWQWDCLSVPDFSAISDAGSGAGYLPKSWTWIWNCGDNPGQYQGATPSQYHPSNVNVSIRISSPGADGPVTQSNVTVAVGSGTTTAHAATNPATESQPAIPTIPSLPALPVPDVPAITAAITASVTVLSPAVTAIAPLTEQGAAALPVPGLPGWIDEPLDLPLVPGVVGGPVALAPFGPVHRPLGPDRAGLVPTLGSTAAVAAIDPRRTIGALTPGEASGRTGATRPGGGRARDVQRPRWHAPAPQPVPESAPSAASVAPATGGGSSNGGIPVFLALPFLAAMLDLARRVVLGGTALPSGHRSRMPDDPG